MVGQIPTQPVYSLKSIQIKYRKKISGDNMNLIHCNFRIRKINTISTIDLNINETRRNDAFLSIDNLNIRIFEAIAYFISKILV